MNTCVSAVGMFTLAQTDDPAGKAVSFLQLVHGGGVVGYIIIALSVTALAMVIVHLVQIRRKALLPPEQIDVVNSLLAQGEVTAALEYCLSPEHDSYLIRILAAGLTRYQKSAFGAFEIKTALEEAGEEQTARLYRSTDLLGVIGAIAPLLGLLGTVLGMVGAFDTVSKSAVSDANYYESLAGNISLALITTLQGLIVAIPCVALFTFFRNRIDAFASEAGAEIERLVLHLESSPRDLSPAIASRAPARGIAGGVARPAAASTSPLPAAGGSEPSP